MQKKRFAHGQFSRDLSPTKPVREALRYSLYLCFWIRQAKKYFLACLFFYCPAPKIVVE